MIINEKVTLINLYKNHPEKCFLCGSYGFYKYDDVRAEKYCLICGAVINDASPFNLFQYLDNAGGELGNSEKMIN